MLKKLIVLAFLSVPFPAIAAWDGSTQGKIDTIEVTHESNYAFRVILEGGPTLCNSTRTFAYLNKSDSNYETYVSLLTAAKFAKTSVTIFANQTANGYCKIGHIYVH